MENAKVKISAIDATDFDNERKDLEIEFQRLELEEKLSREINVEDLKNAWKEYNYKKESDDKLLFRVLDSSKIVLEKCFAYIQQNVQWIRDESDPKPKQHFYLSKIKFDNNVEESKKLSRIDNEFKNFGWTIGEDSFSDILPNLAVFFADHLDIAKHDFLPKFVAIRNKGQHHLIENQIKELEENFPKIEDKKKLAKTVYEYTVKAWTTVIEEIDKINGKVPRI